MAKRLSKANCNVKVRAAREMFFRNGICVEKWSEDRGLSPSLVYAVLAGRRPCYRGQSHKIAVLLGIKDGVIDEAQHEEN